jgi:hypothetical protein
MRLRVPATALEITLGRPAHIPQTELQRASPGSNEPPGIFDLQNGLALEGRARFRPTKKKPPVCTNRL